jgi:glyoxylase-like metal-dependent hydrolase (beta-lactamase superfamily II)
MLHEHSAAAFVSHPEFRQSGHMPAGQASSAAPDIRGFFDEVTCSASYLVGDPVSEAAVIIDPVLDFDAGASRVDTHSADRILDAATRQGLTIQWVLETHPHADHLSAADYIRRRTSAKVGVGFGIRQVQGRFGPLFEADDLEPNGGDFDRLFEDGETLAVGGLQFEVMATPGHTPACVSYRVGDAVFVGDTLFMPDYGTARADFPGGDARQLYRSIHRILSLPRETRLFLCHDYKAPGRDQFAWETTVGEQLDHNIHIHAGVNEEDYVAMRSTRDATLSAPKLLYPALQVNIRAGRLPPQDVNGTRYLKLPLSFAGELF